MKRHHFLLLIAFVIILLSLLILVNRYYPVLWNSNSLHVSIEEPLNTNKVNISFEAPGIAKHIVYRNGSISGEIGNVYGENDFTITYDTIYWLEFRQFKRNWKNQHDYYFNFFTRDDSVWVEVDIRGEDGLRFSEPLRKQK